MAAKSRIQRNKKPANPEDARQIKRLFIITGICVVLLLIIIYAFFA